MLHLRRPLRQVQLHIENVFRAVSSRYFEYCATVSAEYTRTKEAQSFSPKSREILVRSRYMERDVHAQNHTQKCRGFHAVRHFGSDMSCLAHILLDEGHILLDEGHE